MRKHFARRTERNRLTPPDKVPPTIFLGSRVAPARVLRALGTHPKQPRSKPMLSRLQLLNYAFCLAAACYYLTCAILEVV